MAFSNPITGGQGTLVRPAIKSPGYNPGVAGWSINRDGSAEFNDLTIRGEFDGTNFQMTDQGAFFYNGTPALGNLIASIVAQAGTDPFGNAFSRVFNVGNQQGAHFGVDSAGIVYVVNSANQAVIQLNPNKSAVFLYNGTPAAGNLMLSASPTSGNDPFGNAYVAGFASYGMDQLGRPIISNIANGSVLSYPPGGTLQPGGMQITSLTPATVFRLTLGPPQNIAAGLAAPVMEMYTESVAAAADDKIQLFASNINLFPGVGWNVNGVAQGFGRVDFVATQTTTATTTTTETVALTGATVTFQANRAYRIGAHGLAQSTVAADRVSIRVRKTNTAGASLLDFGQAITIPAAAVQSLFDASVIVVTNGAPPTAPLVLTYQRSSGTGNVSVFANSTNPAYMGIEDIGAASDYPGARLLT
jgi:hypothetical protein